MDPAHAPYPLSVAFSPPLTHTPPYPLLPPQGLDMVDKVLRDELRRRGMSAENIDKVSGVLTTVGPALVEGDLDTVLVAILKAGEIPLGTIDVIKDIFKAHWPAVFNG